MPTFNIYMPLVFLFIIITVPSLKTEAAPEYLYHICSNTSTYSPNSTYQSNLNLVLSSLSSNAITVNGFYNVTAGTDRQDTVYGLFLCRGDVTADVCQDCVAKATSAILSQQYCPKEKTAIIWYDYCMLRYDNQSFFSVMEYSPYVLLTNTQNVTEQSRLNQIVYDTMDKISIRAASLQSGKKFATGEANFMATYNNIYNLVQCTPDISAADCNRCLQTAVAALPNCCSGKQGGNVLLPSCNIRYEVYQFYSIPPPVLFSPSTFLYNDCDNTRTYTANTTYQANLSGLLSSLSSNAKRDSGFYSSNVGKDSPDIAYGLFLCRGDISADDCQNCVKTASTEIVRRCTSEKVAIIWYDECMLRYSYQSIYSILDVDPSWAMQNVQNVSEPGRFDQLLKETVSELVDEQIGGKKYAAKPVDFSNFTQIQTLYAFVQCTPDLSFNDCRTCLTQASFQVVNFASGMIGGRLLTPSCFVRYEIYPFYTVAWTALGPSPSTTGVLGGVKIFSPWLGIGISVSAFIVIVLFGSCIFYKWRRKRAEGNSENQEIQLQEYFEEGRLLADNYSNENLQGDEHAKSQDFPLIRLGLINAATKNFSEENKLGEGGFGPVYKGTLVDGKEIAVKRLSKTSGQGLREFKTEVTLIAKLQHRNLVRLLGCCLEGQESLLVYEYMPNKSLDFFLFDSNKGAQLDWKTRLGIINGVARGLLYLHEDSRLRIIHRDLKVSNILLDHEMNPKISDFGMARIFGGNQNEGNTNTVVGTYGYMAPEYAMEGQFSVKSDVFSFGVLLLEIISGKKNSGFHLSEHGESLLNFAWKLWSKGQGMELVDSFVVQSCVAIEVLKCIHIGLLCVQEDAADRPTMSSVVVMLGSETATFPQPTQPAFSVGRLVMRSVESTSNNQVNSVNEVTLSDVSPR